LRATPRPVVHMSSVLGTCATAARIGFDPLPRPLPADTGRLDVHRTRRRDQVPGHHAAGGPAAPDNHDGRRSATGVMAPVGYERANARPRHECHQRVHRAATGPALRSRGPSVAFAATYGSLATRPEWSGWVALGAAVLGAAQARLPPVVWTVLRRAPRASRPPDPRTESCSPGRCGRSRSAGPPWRLPSSPRICLVGFWVDRTWQYPNRVCAAQGPSVMIKPGKLRSSSGPS
jgi:hypothetical protein